MQTRIRYEFRTPALSLTRDRPPENWDHFIHSECTLASQQDSLTNFVTTACLDIPMGDPVSAIIGLGASLTTLAGLVLESAKTLHAAQQHFREAPKDIARLHHQLYQFNRLLGETLKQIHSDDSGRTADMRTLIEDSAQYMRKDLEELSADIRNLKNILDTSASRSKRLRLRLRHIFTENKVARYQQLIASHTQALTLSLALVTKYEGLF